MTSDNTKSSVPWLGIIVLTGAILIAVRLLAGPVSWAGLVQTWYLTRAAGLVAFVLLWLSVALGLLQSTGLLKGVTSPLANIDVHAFVSLGALYATAFHALILLWDRHVPFALTEILIPFYGGQRPFLVGLGTLAFYIGLGATITTYLRAKLTPKLWRSVHQLTLAGFAFALVHGVLLGTDTGLPAVGYLYRFTAISVAALLACRVYNGISGNADPARRG